MTPRKLTASLAAVAALTFAAGCGDDDSSDSGSSGATTESAPTSPTTVTIKTFDFQPDPIQIKAGETVTWVNDDAIKHDVTLGPRDKPTGEFAKDLPDKGAKVQYTFEQAGSYPYVCTIHPGPGMEGVVEVS